LEWSQTVNSEQAKKVQLWFNLKQIDMKKLFDKRMTNGEIFMIIAAIALFTALSIALILNQ